jgi:nitronate monooxygenase
MFLTSGPALVTACCRAGVVGTFPALNQRTTEGFIAWLSEIEAALAAPGADGRVPAPYGVNLIVHRTNPRLAADLDACVARKVPVIITSLGAASEVVDRVHSYGGVVFHDVTNVRHAEKAAEAGVDGLILVAAGAGGHAGTTSPFALLNEVRRVFPGTLLLSGCMSTGRDIAAAEMMGADLAYLGTRFIATAEAMVPDTYKRMIVESSAADILYTPSISSIPANFLKKSIVAAGLDPEKLAPAPGVDLAHITEPHKEEGEAERARLQGAKPWRDLWSAGQGVGSIDDVPKTAALVDRLASEYRAAADGFAAESRRYGR